MNRRRAVTCVGLEAKNDVWRQSPEFAQVKS